MQQDFTIGTLNGPSAPAAAADRDDPAAAITADMGGWHSAADSVSSPPLKSLRAARNTLFGEPHES